MGEAHYTTAQSTSDPDNRRRRGQGNRNSLGGLSGHTSRMDGRTVLHNGTNSIINTKRQIRRLKGEVQRLTGQLGTTQKEAERLANENQASSEQAVRQTREIKRLSKQQKRLEAIETRNAELEAELASEISETRRLKGVVAKLNAELDAQGDKPESAVFYQKQLSVMREENNRLFMELTLVRSAKADLQEASSKAVLSLQNKLDSLNSALESAESERTKLKVSIQNRDKDISDLQTNFRNEKEKLRLNFEQEVMKLKREFADMHSVIMSECQEKAGIAEESRNGMVSRDMEKVKIKVPLQGVEAAGSQAIPQIEILRRRFFEKVTELEEAKRRIKELESSNSQVKIMSEGAGANVVNS